MMQEIIFVEASTTGAGSRAHELSRAEGFTVTLLTMDKSRYGGDILSSSDNVILCETNNHTEVVRTVRRRSLISKVAAVTTTADMYVPQAALAAQQMALPGLSCAGARRVRNKYLMRRALAKRVPEYNVSFFLAVSLDEALAAAQQLRYPLVVKPQEENDGVGVKLIRSKSQLKDYVATGLGWTHNPPTKCCPQEF